uniref:Uncharacterized protein n=1 Tax=Brassica oleracea var. oleracea TaxID=109376 RepID=A0A0D3D638_BRAOL
MNKPLFMHIVDRLSNEVEFFRQKKDAIRRLSLSPLQKCTTAIRVLAYGIIYLFGDEYLRRPTPTDLQRLLDIGEHRGFPRMIESIDCMHYKWKNCPTAWKGTLNDINVLDRSPVFDDIIKSQAPQVTFSVNGREYNLAYYLTDGIYPKWSTFIQSIPIPQGPKAVLFAQHQEAARKDVERAFGVLQARFAIKTNEMDTLNLMFQNSNQEKTGSSHVDLTYSTDIPTNIANMMGVRTRIRDRQMHQQLKDDLIEHIWHKFGGDGDNY